MPPLDQDRQALVPTTAAPSDITTAADRTADVAHIPLINTKFYVPRPRPDTVSRPRLDARLDAGTGAPLTLVAAPAGFGKTTIVAQWLHRIAYPVAWLSLDSGDNDPSAFLRYLVGALRTLVPGIGAITL